LNRNLYGIMIKYPEPGKVKTRLAKDIGDEKAAAVYKQLAEKVMENTKPSLLGSPFTKEFISKKTPPLLYEPWPPRARMAQKSSPPLRGGDEGEGAIRGFTYGLISNKRPPLAISLNPSFPKRGTSDALPGAHYCEMMYERIVFFDPPELRKDFEAWLPGSRLISQRGADVGERMDNSLRDLLELGAEKAVITGADIPDLTSLIIMEAFAALDHADIVIGPARDGGYYLIGMKAPHPELFQDIQWSTGSVFEETMRRIEKLRFTCASITTLSDLDTVEDYNRLLL
jgi:rSAM/selenodomain-associated transferase 1